MAELLPHVRRKGKGGLLEEKMRWSVEQRLEFIEYRLFWEGHVNRGDLVEHFGVSVPQASADLSRYQELAPGNIEYDSSAKRYVVTAGFHPVKFSPSADRFLNRLRTVDSELDHKQDHWLDQLPPIATVPLLRRRVDAAVLRKVLGAIRKKVALYVHYQSQSSPEPTWRWIAPHALGFSGFRWHARAWCHERKDFRDFGLARILAAKDTKETEAQADQDIEWQHQVILRIGTRQDLDEGARRAVEIDYGMKEGCIEIRMRIALSRYFERLLALDVPLAALEPSRQPLMLLNREEVESARVRARKVSTHT